MLIQLPSLNAVSNKYNGIIMMGIMIPSSKFIARHAGEFQIVLLSEAHSVLIQLPTPPMMAITAISRMPSSTVYSINAAPSSSDLS